MQLILLKIDLKVMIRRKKKKMSLDYRRLIGLEIIKFLLVDKMIFRTWVAKINHKIYFLINEFKNKIYYIHL